MARTRKTWPTETGEGRRSYPWTEWLDGSIWFLEAGRDYTCSTTAMRSQVGMRCNAAGLEYRTHRAADGSGLYVQTFPAGTRAVEARRARTLSEVR